MALKYYPLKISKIAKIAENAACLSFDIPKQLREEFDFKPGQHLTFEQEINGDKLRRFYSICSSPADSELRIAVRQIEEGRFSSHLNNSINAGDTLHVLPPRGRFSVKDENKGTHILAFAAGSGITPIYAIISHHLAADENASATLVFGNKSRNTIMLRDDIADLKDQYLGRFQLIHILSREQQDVEMLNGRIDDKSVTNLAEKGMIFPQKASQIFVCGPGDMIDNVQAALVSLDVNKDNITIEQFTAVKSNKPISNKVKKNISSGAQVSYILDGVEKKFSLDNPEDTVLSAAQNAGHDLPFSCAGGMCATCRCKLVEGEVEMATNYALEDWELEAGYVLACQSRPKTTTIKLDFDAS